MKRNNIIILTLGIYSEAWGSLTECCKVHGFPYHSLKNKKYPFVYHDFVFQKIEFRKKLI